MQPIVESRSKAPPAAANPRGHDPLPCHDPATGEPLGQVPVMDRAAVLDRIHRARGAQREWSRTSFAERRAVMRSVLEDVVARQDEICRLSARDSGKTAVDAAMGEIFPVCEKLRYTIAQGERDLRPERRAPGFLLHKVARVEYRPFGVIGVIAPWNFPFHNLFCPTIPALFAGNAVVAKVSEWTSWSADAYLQIFRDALRRHGHSPDLVQVVTGYGQTGADLATGGVDKVFFTGSPRNGRKVMEGASSGPTPVVLELGGKDPMIICDDADLKRAADAAMLGVFTSAGQMCVSAERLYVFDGIYDRFVNTVVERARALRQGPPLGEHRVDLGAMTMPRQLDIIEDLVADAVTRGARVLVGGNRREDLGGQFFEPTVLVDVDHSMRIMREEHFGPIMVIVRVQSEEEAVRLANDCPYGLGSSVFTRDARRADRIARELRTGMTVVNDYGLAYMIQSLPFGGVGVSGFGRINGREGLRACCYEHAVVTDRLPFGKSVAIHPIRPSTYDVVKGAVGVLYGQGLRARARAAAHAIRSMASLARE